MKIAVPHDGGNIFQHFGHAEHFKVYDIESGSVTTATILDTNGNGHGALVGLLKENGVDALICGGIGGGAQSALAQAGIRLHGGVSGDADQAMEAFLAGSLIFTTEPTCNHHDKNGHQHTNDGHCGGKCHG